MARKLVISDGHRERSMLLVANMVVGRDPVCEISEDDALLSRRHAEFVVGGADVLVRDLGSRNGVYVNGLKVAEGALRSGDLVRIGHLEMRYLEDATPLAAALAAAVADSTAFVPAAAPVQAPASDDEERTRLVRPPVREVSAQPAAADEEYTRVVKPPTIRMPAATVLLAPADDEERTRLLRSAATGVAAPSAAEAEPSASDLTTVVAAPSRAPVQAPATARTQAWSGDSSPVPPTPVTGAGFVFAHVALLAVIVSAAAMAPFLVRGESPLDGTGLAASGLSGAVIALTTYVFGARIAGRLRPAQRTQDRD